MRSICEWFELTVKWEFQALNTFHAHTFRYDSVDFRSFVSHNGVTMPVDTRPTHDYESFRYNSTPSSPHPRIWVIMAWPCLLTRVQRMTSYSDTPHRIWVIPLFRYSYTPTRINPRFNSPPTVYESFPPSDKSSQMSHTRIFTPHRKIINFIIIIYIFIYIMGINGREWKHKWQGMKA